MDTTEFRNILKKGEDGFFLVHCKDKKLDTEDMIKIWGEELLSFMDDPECKYMILSLDHVALISSSALRYLILGHQKGAELKKPFGVCNINEDIMETIQMTCLDKFFNIGNNEDEIRKILLSIGEEQEFDLS